MNVSEPILYNIFVHFGLPIFAYLLGSISWGLVLTRLFSSVDIRKQGSGNIGATNVSRVAGSTLGMLTFVGDILKGVIPVFIAVLVSDAFDRWMDFYLSIVALGAFLGHLYPVFTKFKSGGKGVATTAGCFVVLAPWACLIALGAFILLISISRYISVGSLAAAIILPFAVWFSTFSIPLTVCAAMMAVFIFLRHRQNIKRLFSGTEPKFKERK
jgi:glycerol-3-phosphate acyltransferase PlsY